MTTKTNHNPNNFPIDSHIKIEAASPPLTLPLWKRADIAAHYQVTTRTVASWHAQGKLPFIQINPRCIRYCAEAVKLALSEQSEISASIDKLK